MMLAELARVTKTRLVGEGELEVRGITHNAQGSLPGFVFAALPGLRRHGIEFVDQARELGAIAVLSDRNPGSGVAWLQTPAPRKATALAAWALAGHPEERLRFIGITGTKGKSTVADLVGRIAVAAGEIPGIFGTIAYTIPGRSQHASRTTPEATELAPFLSELAEKGGTVVAMEVSSIALCLDRVAGLPFDVAVWTNLTRDHLDFHHDMEEYFLAKQSLQNLLRVDPPGRRVIGADDPFMARLLTESRPGDLSFGFAPTCQVTARKVEISARNIRFELCTPIGDREILMPLVGRHNLSNALAAAAVGVAMDWPLDAITTGLANAEPLPGRLERIEDVHSGEVFVDYAHTPDALEKVLQALRELATGKLIVVFGCGGDRDTGKRAPMGEVVGRLADVPIVTSDNPRSEDPNAIIAQIIEGVRASGNLRALAIADRREAIAAALSMADVNDLVLVAGKGHETEQIFSDHTIPFDDRQVVRELAKRRRG